MDSMDPDKIDTDDFQLIMSLGSMEDARECMSYIQCKLKNHYLVKLKLEMVIRWYL